jgi:hypothetical protein
VKGKNRFEGELKLFPFKTRFFLANQKNLPTQTWSIKLIEKKSHELETRKRIQTCKSIPRAFETTQDIFQFIKTYTYKWFYIL